MIQRGSLPKSSTRRSPPERRRSGLCRPRRHQPSAAATWVPSCHEEGSLLHQSNLTARHDFPPWHSILNRAQRVSIMVASDQTKYARWRNALPKDYP